MSDIVYCLNVFDREKQLRETINKINEMFDYPSIYVASNGTEAMSNLPDNVLFEWFGCNQGWQLGALNGCCQALRMAAEYEPDIRKKAVIFSHDDIVPVNRDKILSLCEHVTKWCVDVVARLYTKNLVNQTTFAYNKPYVMIENLVLSGQVVSNFYDFPIIESLTESCAEIEFGQILNRMYPTGYNHSFYGFDQNFDMKENEMGFLHNHAH